MIRFLHKSLVCFLVWQLAAGTIGALALSPQAFAQTRPAQDEKKAPVNATPPAGQSAGSNTPGQQGGGQTPGQPGGSGNSPAQPGAGSQPAVPASTATPAAEDNGITIGQPKQFDERTLTLMLQSLEDKLARTQFPDPSGLYSTRIRP